MPKNYKWGIFPGKWGAKAKKRLPRRTKKRGSLPRNPKADISRDASRFRRSGAPSPAGTNVPAGDGAPEAIRPVPKHASRGIRLFAAEIKDDRTAFSKWTAGSGRETCLRVDSGHTPHAPPSGADFKTRCNDPKSSGYPTAELRIDGLSKMPERCCCPKRCTCQGFAHLPANRDSTK